MPRLLLMRAGGLVQPLPGAARSPASHCASSGHCHFRLGDANGQPQPAFAGRRACFDFSAARWGTGDARGLGCTEARAICSSSVESMQRASRRFVRASSRLKAQLEGAKVWSDLAPQRARAGAATGHRLDHRWACSRLARCGDSPCERQRAAHIPVVLDSVRRQVRRLIHGETALRHVPGPKAKPGQTVAAKQLRWWM